MCKHYGFILTEDHRYYINDSTLNNCMYCAIEKHGPMTYEQIANYIGCTKMNVLYIERRAIKKIINPENSTINRENFMD